MGTLSAPAIRVRKVRDGADRLVMVTAYDAPSARVVSEAGADLILVGDSLAMVVLGYDDTLQVTVKDMAHHVAAVARTKPDAHIVADLPWMSYHVSASKTVQNAALLVRAGAHSVKLEGGRKRLPMIERICDAEIPVMGHIGLTPQSVHANGRLQRSRAARPRRLAGWCRRPSRWRTPVATRSSSKACPGAGGRDGHRSGGDSHDRHRRRSPL